MVLGLGVVLFIAGLIIDMSGGGGHEEGHATVKSEQLTASTDAVAQEQEHENDMKNHQEGAVLQART